MRLYLNLLLGLLRRVLRSRDDLLMAAQLSPKRRLDIVSRTTESPHVRLARVDEGRERRVTNGDTDSVTVTLRP